MICLKPVFWLALTNYVSHTLRKSSASISVEELWSRGMEAPTVKLPKMEALGLDGAKMNNEATEDE